jgi:hypothetical protein
MIVYETFSRLKGLTASGMLQGQQEARAEALAFIAERLEPEDVVSVTESALPSTWSQGLFTVTVWYRKR